jgi:hypothetical protein
MKPEKRDLILFVIIDFVVNVIIVIAVLNKG